MNAAFEVHDRVEYIATGPQGYLRGVHGSVHAVHTLDSGATVADVLFDGHTALWSIPPKHLAHLAEAVPALVALDRAVAADRLAASVEDVARVLRMVHSIGDRHAYVADMLKALDDYRSAATR